MAVTTLNTTASDGYIEGTGAPAGAGSAAFSTTTTLLASTTSSSDTTRNQTFIPIDTSSLAGVTINSVKFFIFIRSHTSNNVSTQLYLQTKKGGVTYPLGVGSFDVAATAVLNQAVDSLDTLDWWGSAAGKTIPPANIETAGITNFILSAYAASDIPGDSVTFDAFENASGNVAHIVVDYSSGTAYIKTLTDTLTIVENFRKTLGRNLNETITLSATIKNGAGKVLVEGTTVTDVVVKAVAKGLIDVITGIEIIAKTLSRTFIETVTTSDVVVKIHGFIRSFVEFITTSDSMSSVHGYVVILFDRIRHVESWAIRWNGRLTNLWRRITRSRNNDWTRLNKDL